MSDTPTPAGIIDLEAVAAGTDELMTLAAAGRHPLLRRNGRARHASRLHDWARNGVRGPDGERVRLATIKTPSGLATSRNAIVAFVRRLNGEGDVLPAHTPRSRERHLAGIERQLEAAGL